VKVRRSVANTFCFEGMTLDPDARELARGGAAVDVEPKVFDLLLYLVERRDRAVDKDELQDRIWAGLVVTEASLTRCVMKARRAVGDEVRPHRIIRTIHGFGYRFVADVEAGPQTPVLEPDRLAPPAKPSIAVLPFFGKPSR
jgi:DNA-binding winged helix-turn-helix (wHTH) protein